ncbi:MAG TPA: methyltransferase domain-containing protein [Dehalococcoidia bacterium]|nr:methyltransferase domain-containing protein [Dehalococcoidia bacterium]
MPQDTRNHKEVVREEFTRQAQAYAANPHIGDPERVARLVLAIHPPPDARVLEVATGPGYVALGFAAVCREVVGVDLTAAPLAIAERQRREQGLDNVRFQEADAEDLPFPDGDFDVVVCRLAFHHFEDPPKVLAEMTRVCREHGTVAVEDLIVSEDPNRAAYQNRFENLRDPSHTRAFPLSRLLTLFAAAGLDVENVSMARREQVVERWLANAHTPADRAAEVRSLIERDAREDLSGARPFYRDGRLHFVHRSAIVVGRRLAPAR